MTMKYFLWILSRVLSVGSFLTFISMGGYLIIGAKKAGLVILIGSTALAIFLILLLFDRIRRSRWPVPGIDYL